MARISMFKALLLVAGLLGSGCSDAETGEVSQPTGAFEFMVQVSTSAYVVRETGAAQHLGYGCEARGVSADRNVASFFTARGITLLFRDGSSVEFPSQSELHWSPEGRSIALPSESGLLIANADGTTRHELPLDFRSPSNLDITSLIAWSPDGRYLATSSSGVRTVDADTGELYEVTASPGLASWSPNSQRLASLHDKDSWEHSLTLADSEGSEAVTLSGFGPWSALHGWSPDGQWVAASGLNSTGNTDDGQLRVLDSGGSVVATAPPSVRAISREARWAWHAPILAHYTELEPSLPAFGLWSPEGTRTLPFGDVCATASILEPRWSPDDLLVAYECYANDAAIELATVLVDLRVPSVRATWPTKVKWNADWSRAATLRGNGELKVMGPTGENPKTLATAVREYSWLRSPDALAYWTKNELYVARADGSQSRKVLDFAEVDPPMLYAQVP